MKICRKGLHQFSGKQCGECIKITNKAWKEANSEQEKANTKAWKEANKDKIKAWYEANKEVCNAKKKAWKEVNKEREKANQKAYQKAIMLDDELVELRDIEITRKATEKRKEELEKAKRLKKFSGKTSSVNVAPASPRALLDDIVSKHLAGAL